MRYHLSRRAISDIVDALATSEEKFGLEAQARYATLIDQATRDIADEVQIGRLAFERRNLPGQISGDMWA